MSEQVINPLLNELEQEIHRLLQHISSLKKENASLKAQLLEKPKQAQSDLFGELSLPDKIALKAKVNQMIHKVDQHLEKLNG
ncbi:hypothetical protein EP331_06995 [bacterium]|nr:MAG: hypothetical protein EP331_06995 [bacterium]